jgi:O-antigen chain-terminating methyltransferase
MLLPNNPDVDTEVLNDKLNAITAHRRRATPLLASPEIEALQAGQAAPGVPAAHSFPTRAPGLRGLVKSLPLVGPVAVAAYRRTHDILSPGLNWKQRLRLLPLIGAFAAWTSSVVRLNTVRQQIALELIALRRAQHDAHRTSEQLAARIQQLHDLQQSQAGQLSQIDAAQTQRSTELAALQAAQTQVLDAVRQDQAAHALALDAVGLQQAALACATEAIDQKQAAQAQAMQLVDQALAACARQLAQLDALNLATKLDLYDAFTHSTMAGAVHTANRIASLTRELRQLTEPAEHSNAPSDILQHHVSASLDNFYLEFEDTFRGSRQDITERLKVYLPYLKNFRTDATAQALDLGCGRGEWLALMRGQGISATGLDLNPLMVETCRIYGLQAHCGDAIQYLRQQPQDSLAIITGFHIIEHLPFATLLELFDAALRALRPDGLIIFETPNPENLAVGACNFHYDPTHLKPIVPAVAEFIAHQRGFAQAQILRLHPYPPSHQLPADSEIANRINTALYGPQDYAVLAWKTHAN